MRQHGARIVALLMVVVLPASVIMADDAAGMLTTVGEVQLNGVGVIQPTAVFPGDRVQTTSNSAATLTMRGASVTLPADSVVLLAKNELDIPCGSAMVNTVKGVSTRVSNVVVAPAGDSAKFEVVQDHDQMQIIAREGTLAVNDGSVRTLQPGGVLLASASGCAAGSMWADAYSPPQGGSSAPPPTGGQSKAGPVLLGLIALLAMFFIACETTKSHVMSPSGLCS